MISWAREPACHGGLEVAVADDQVAEVGRARGKELVYEQDS